MNEEPTPDHSGTSPSDEESSLVPHPWARVMFPTLLNYRIKDLGLKLEGSGIEKKVDRLYTELDLKGVCFHPPCYLGVEWACPDGVPAIGIAFYLAHPRLKRLEKRMMLEVEGAMPGEFMRILRHECGHAINYAFLLHRKKKWAKLFGSFQQEYRDVYRVMPYSRRFVRNLSGNYAQMHPDEDFAETFAVWLNPNVDWRKEYAGWGALEKLEYVDELMRKEVIDELPRVVPKARDFLWHVDRVTTTLAAHYKRRRAEHAHEYTDYYDRELLQLFISDPELGGESAARFLNAHRRRIMDIVSRWSLESKVNLNELFASVVERCTELELRVACPEADELLDVVAYFVSLAVNYKHTGEYKRHR